MGESSDFLVSWSRTDDIKPGMQVQYAFLFPLIIHQNFSLWEWSWTMWVLKMKFKACLHKHQSMNFNLKKHALIVITVHAVCVWLDDYWQALALVFSITAIVLFISVSAVCRTFICEMTVLSSPSFWCYSHFTISKLSSFGLGNGNAFHSVLSTVSLLSTHQIRYLILRNSSAAFHPFCALIEALLFDQVCVFCPSLVLLVHISVSEDACFPLTSYIVEDNVKLANGFWWEQALWVLSIPVSEFQL